MTKREMYVFGWVYGVLAKRLDYNKDIQQTAMRPFSAQAQIIKFAAIKHILHGDLDTMLANALNQIKTIEPEMESGTEKVQPLPMQAIWQMGYFAGQSGESLKTE